MTRTCIIIGAGHAAAQLSTSLRQEGWEGEIIIIGDEPYPPYHRPPLSKTFLAGDKTVDDLAIRPSGFYEKNKITFRRGHVRHIDREKQVVTLDENHSSSHTLDYDKLALCMGGRARILSLPGSGLKGVHYLRGIDDVENMRPHLGQGKNAVIIGGGYIGLETAALMRGLGMNVAILESAPRVLQRVTAPSVSDFYTRVHKEEGVNIHTNVHVARIVGNGGVEKVVCKDGTEFAADLVVVGIGVIANTELAETAGLDVDNGIVVDEFCTTSDQNIVAAGDCTNHYNALYDRRIRLESVPNANEQAKVAAASICGNQKANQSLPWFWSDQYDMKLQIAGLSQGYEQVEIRGDAVKSRSFAAFYFKESQLICADCVNRPQEFMLAKRIIAQQLEVNQTRLTDDTVPVKEIGLV